MSRRSACAAPTIVHDACTADHPPAKDSTSSTCTSTPSTPCSTARPASATCSQRAAEMGMPALATTDHGYVFGAYEFWKKAAGHRRQADHRRRGLRHPRHPPHRQDPGQVGRRAHQPRRRRLRLGRLHPHDPAGPRQHRPAQPVPDGLPGLASTRSTPSGRASTASCSTSTAQGLIATTGCPSGEIQTRLRLGQYERGQAGGLRLPRHLRRRELLLRAHGPRPRHRAPRPEGPPPPGPRARPAARRHQRPALHQPRGRQGPLGPAVRAVRLDADGPQPVQVRRRRLLPQEPGRDAPHRGASCPRPATTPCSSPRCATSRSPRARGATCRASPARRGRTRRAGSSRRSQTRPARAVPRRHPRLRARRRRSSRPTSSSPRGMPGYFLVVADFISWAKDNGIRVGPGRGSGAGSMCAYAMKITDLDPIPHGLIFERFLNPERPSLPDFDVDFDERRRGEVIRYVTEKYGERAGRPDRHLRHDQGQAGRQGRRPRHGPPLRRGRAADQGDAAGRHGQGRAAVGHLRPRAPALRRGQGVPRARRRRSRTLKEVVETALGLEGLKRQWGVHAAGVIMSSEPLIDVIPIMRRDAGRPGHHPVRLPELRGARPGQDGLPRACATSRSSTTPSPT